MSLSIASVPVITEASIVVYCTDSERLSSTVRGRIGRWLCKDDRILRRGGIYHMQHPGLSPSTAIEVVALRPFSEGCAIEGKTRILALPKKKATCTPVSPLASTECLEDVEITIDETFLASSINRITSDSKHLEVKLIPRVTVGVFPHQYDCSYDVFVPASTLGRLGVFDHGWVRIYHCFPSMHE